MNTHRARRSPVAGEPQRVQYDLSQALPVHSPEAYLRPTAPRATLWTPAAHEPHKWDRLRLAAACPSTSSWKCPECASCRASVIDGVRVTSPAPGLALFEHAQLSY